MWPVALGRAPFALSVTGEQGKVFDRDLSPEKEAPVLQLQAVDGGARGKLLHRIWGAKVARIVCSSARLKKAPLFVDGDQAMVGLFQEADEQCRASGSQTESTAEFGVAPGSGSRLIFRPSAQAAIR